jgi:hypothetical protein
VAERYGRRATHVDVGVFERRDQGPHGSFRFVSHLTQRQGRVLAHARVVVFQRLDQSYYDVGTGFTFCVRVGSVRVCPAVETAVGVERDSRNPQQ